MTLVQASCKTINRFSFLFSSYFLNRYCIISWEMTRLKSWSSMSVTMGTCYSPCCSSARNCPKSFQASFSVSLLPCNLLTTWILVAIIAIIAWSDTYNWVVCGLVWLQEWIPKRRVFQETGLRAQDMITILGSIFSIIGEGGDTYTIIFMSMWDFTLVTNKISI